ncbi:MAG: hypothetical protein N3E51_00460 [Candidatus Micrarchaeota archaeon]|nr:hypothetical protein [Candidatus Micrarchaeota archaeon]
MAKRKPSKSKALKKSKKGKKVVLKAKPKPAVVVWGKVRRPDIRVKKKTYSKAVRAAVLSSAIARQKLIEMGGENTIDVIREFDKDMSDEELARRTGIKASDVRVVLNRLHTEGIFSYTRVRDKDSGWYSYIWKMNEDKLREVVSGGEGAGAERTEEYGDKECYVCPACGEKKLFDFETASEMKFKCSECGAFLEFFERKPQKP